MENKTANELDKIKSQVLTTEIENHVEEEIDLTKDIEKMAEAYESKEYDEAIRLAENILKINKIEETALYLRAAATFDKGTYTQDNSLRTKSIEYFDEVLLLESTFYHSDAWFNKGLAYIKLSNYKDASTCLSKAIEFDPNDEEAWFHKGYTEYVLGNHIISANCLKKVLEINPLNINAKLLLPIVNNKYFD